MSASADRINAHGTRAKPDKAADGKAAAVDVGKGWRLLVKGEPVLLYDQYHDHLAIVPEWRPVSVEMLGVQYAAGLFPPCRRRTGNGKAPGPEKGAPKR